jgi:hypothetical protein
LIIVFFFNGNPKNNLVEINLKNRPPNRPPEKKKPLQSIDLQGFLNV